MAGGNHKILGPFPLEHRMHRHHVFRGPAPVALHGKVAERERLLLASGNPAGGGGDLLRHKPFGPQRAFVVEEDAGAGMHAVGLAVLGDLPEGGRLGDAVGAARVEHSLFGGRLAVGIAKHLRAAGVVEAGAAAEHANGFEQVYRCDDDAFIRFHRLVE